MTYRREIDGLRAIALLPVVFYHAGFLAFSGAFVMLDVFFVISGYLISSLILKELDNNTFSLLHFYERRARRILPVLFLVMLCCIPFAWHWLMPLELTMFSKSLVAVCLFSSNFLFWKESGYFEPANDLKPLLHTWSLAVEEQFYLIFPLFFLFAWKWKQKGLLTLVISASALSIGVMQWGTLNSPDANYYLLPGRAWEFLLGMLISLYIQPIQQKASTLSTWFSQIAAFLGMAMLITSLFTFNRYESFPSLYAFIPLLGTALIILFATPATLIGKVLCSRPLVGIGLISYSGYLWHQPLFAFARHALLKEPEPWIFGMLIIFNFILSYFSWKLVEQPFRRGRWISRDRLFRLGALFTLVIVLFGGAAISMKGFPQRFKLEQLSIQTLLAKAAANSAALPGRRRPQYDPAKSIPLSDFIDKWKADTASPSSLTFIPLAFFGSSISADIQTSLERQGFRTIGLFGGGCSINPQRMSASCQELARNLYDFVRSHTEIRYLGLACRTYDHSELSIDFLKEAVAFWKPLNIKLIIFSPKPEFEFMKETLQRGEYPKPSLTFSELSLRKEITDYLTSEDVHLVNAKDIFCKISGGRCDFKTGPKTRFRPEDFLYYDGWHLTATGQKEFGRILLETDPIFRQIIEEAKAQRDQ